MFCAIIMISFGYPKPDEKKMVHQEHLDALFVPWEGYVAMIQDREQVIVYPRKKGKSAKKRRTTERVVRLHIK